MTNYLRDNDGKFIPATQRPDGTWRKARRVKEGYIPQEEVPLYESKGKQFARKPEYPVGMCPIIAKVEKEKRERQHLKKNKTNASPGVIILPNSITSTSNDLMKPSNPPASNCSSNLHTEKSALNSLEADVSNLNLDDEREEQLRKLRKMKKKVREIEMIEAKIKSGELKKPEKDQLDKVKRKCEILQEIKQLEFTQ